MSHHYEYQPVTNGVQQQQQAARNPWTDPPAAAKQFPQPQQLSPAIDPWFQVQCFTPTPATWLIPQQVSTLPVVYPSIYFPPFLAAPAGMQYPGQPGVQFYTSQPAAEPMNLNQGLGNGNNAQAHHAPEGQGPPPQNPIQLVPHTASPNQQLYCRELDGTFTLQTVNKIMQDLQPGHWKTSSSGFPYWVRLAKA